ncbi:MAG TPA: hypothetical protein VJP77_06600, partial [Planctomycetota bacterium]|nr:hypothetical protein [Planctomycetota bacterium]
GGDGELAEGAGAAYLLEEPSLQGDVESVSAAVGGAQWLALHAGSEHAHAPYLLLGSLSGIEPGLPLDAEHTLPLEPDAYFLHTLAHPNAPPIEGGFGLLDAAGEAQALVGIHAGTELLLPELTLHHAFVVLSPLAEALFVSDPVALQVVQE